jgi:hypothetical protein
MRNRVGIIQRFPTGTDEVENSDVAKTESRRGCGLGLRGHRLGEIPASFTADVRDKEGFYRAKIIINNINQDGKIIDFSVQRGP